MAKSENAHAPNQHLGQNSAQLPAQDDSSYLYDQVSEQTIPGARYYLHKYNPKDQTYDYITALELPFTGDEIRDTYGPGKYMFDVKIKGQFLRKDYIKFGVNPLLARAQPEAPPADAESSTAANNNNGRKEKNQLSARERIQNAMADALELETWDSMRRRMQRPEVAANDNGHKDGLGEFADAFKEFIKMQLRPRDMAADIKSMAETYGLMGKIFGNNGHGAAEEPLTLGEAAASSLLKLTDLFIESKKDPVKFAREHAGSPDKQKADMSEIVILVQKLYAMATSNPPQEPAKGAALCLSFLSPENLKKISLAGTDDLISAIVEKFPQYKQYLESEKGREWLDEMLDIVQESISSQTASAAPGTKSGSSGSSSGTASPAPSSGARPKTSSGTRRGATGPAKPGPSTTGRNKTHGIRTKATR